MELFDLLKKDLKNDNGIYFTKRDKTISYPNEGHEECFQIEEKSFWFKYRNKCIINLIKRFSLPEDEIIEIGGGNGYVAKAIQDMGYKITMIEPHLSGIRNAKERGIKRIICATLEELDISPNVISAIGLFDVLEHVKDDSIFLRKLYELLKPNGQLYITVPAFNFLWSNQDKYASHYRRYNIRNISSLLNNIGFEIKYISYFFSILFIPTLIFITIPSIFSNVRIIKNDLIISNDRVGRVGRLIESIFALEFKRIKKLKIIPFGTSIIIVAKKRHFG